jgi:hypothetical protein
VSDPLSKAAKQLLEPFEGYWPLDLSKMYLVSGASLLGLRNAAQTRKAVNLWAEALANPCSECGVEIGKHCIAKKSGYPVARPHDERMIARCECGHKMNKHTQEGVCTRKELTGKVACSCRCFVKRVLQ